MPTENLGAVVLALVAAVGLGIGIALFDRVWRALQGSGAWHARRRRAAYASFLHDCNRYFVVWATYVGDRRASSPMGRDLPDLFDPGKAYEVIRQSAPSDVSRAVDRLVAATEELASLRHRAAGPVEDLADAWLSAAFRCENALQDARRLVDRDS